MSPVDIVATPPILEVMLDVPKANAISAQTSRLLGEAFGEYRDNAELRVAIFTGAGDRFFSAGWDLKAAAEGEEFEADYGPGGFGGFPELPDLNKPVIAAVNGMAVGGGFELVLAADLAVAADHAEFFFGELAAGIIPDSGTVRLPRQVPLAVAKELILTGRRLSAQEALELGLVNRVVPGDRLMEEARGLANEIAEIAPLAVEAVLEVMRKTAGYTIEDAFSAMRTGELPAYTRMLDSEDAQEGPRAFTEGREPKWKGH